MTSEIKVQFKNLLAPYLGAGVFMNEELVGIVKNIAIGTDDAKICMILEPGVDVDNCSMRLEQNGLKFLLEKES